MSVAEIVFAFIFISMEFESVSAYTRQLAAVAAAGNVDTEACKNLTINFEVVPSFTVLYFLLGTLAFGALTLFLQRFFLTNVPSTLKMFVEGLVLGALHAWSNKGLGAMSESIEMWVNIDPHLLLAVFIPPLIFTDVVKLDLHLLKKTFVQCVILAVPMVLGMIVGLGFAARTLVPQWSDFLVFTFGATLGATDPVSVVSVLELIKCPPKLKMIIGGESHLGDLTSLTVFLIFLDLSTGAATGSTDLITFVLRMVFVGALVGIALGSFVVLLLRKTSDKTSSRAVLLQLLITIALAYVSFVFSENFLKSSGIMCVFTTSLVLAMYSRGYMANIEVIDRIWEVVEYFASTIIFTLAGLILGKELVSNITSGLFTPRDYFLVPVFYLILMALRSILVFLLYKYLKGQGYGMTLREALMVTWGGLRGAVNLTLGIVVQLEIKFTVGEEEASRFLLYVGGVVFLMLLINASLTKFVLNSLGLSQITQVEAEVLKYIRTKFEGSASIVYHKLSAMEEFENHNTSLVVSHVSSLNLERNNKNINENFVDENERVSVGRPRHISFDDALEFANADSTETLLKKQLRSLFYSALSASYWSQIKDGALPLRAVVSNILFYSIDLAKDEVLKGKPLNDFQYTMLPNTLYKYNRHLSRMDWISQYVTLPDFVVQWYGRAHVKLIYNGVFLATIIKEGHENAQQVLKEFTSGGDGNVSSKVVQIIRESESQVKEAENYLEFAETEDRRISDTVHATRLVYKVLEKQRKFVEKLKDQGIINETVRFKMLKGIRLDREAINKLKVDETFDIKQRLTALTAGSSTEETENAHSPERRHSNESDKDSLPPGELTRSTVFNESDI